MIMRTSSILVGFAFSMIQQHCTPPILSRRQPDRPKYLPTLMIKFSNSQQQLLFYQYGFYGLHFRVCLYIKFVHAMCIRIPCLGMRN